MIDQSSDTGRTKGVIAIAAYNMYLLLIAVVIQLILFPIEAYRPGLALYVAISSGFASFGIVPDRSLGWLAVLRGMLIVISVAAVVISAYMYLWYMMGLVPNHVTYWDEVFFQVCLYAFAVVMYYIIRIFITDPLDKADG
jgi:hypothetical protein